MSADWLRPLWREIKTIMLDGGDTPRGGYIQMDEPTEGRQSA